MHSTSVFLDIAKFADFGENGKKMLMSAELRW